MSAFLEKCPLGSGLAATILPQNHPKSKKIVKLCDEKAERGNRTKVSEYGNMRVLEVSLHSTKVYVVITIFPSYNETIKTIIANEGLDELLTHTLYIVYNKQACWWGDVDGQHLLGSIRAGLPPTVYAVLTN